MEFLASPGSKMAILRVFNFMHIIRHYLFLKASGGPCFRSNTPSFVTTPHYRHKIKQAYQENQPDHLEMLERKFMGVPTLPQEPLHHGGCCPIYPS